MTYEYSPRAAGALFSSNFIFHFFFSENTTLVHIYLFCIFLFVNFLKSQLDTLYGHIVTIFYI